MFLVLQLGADEHDALADVDHDNCALQLSKGTLNTCLDPGLGTA